MIRCSRCGEDERLCDCRVPAPSASACPNACYLAGRCLCRPSDSAASPAGGAP